MGTEAFWIPALLAAAGTGTEMYAENRANKERDRIALNGLKTQQRHQSNINAAVDKQLGTLEASSPEAERQKAMSQYVAQLRSARGQAKGASTPGGSRFKEDTATSEAAIQNYGTQQADTLSRMTSAGNQRRNESIGNARLGAEIGQNANFAQGDNAVTTMKVNSVQADPWLKGLAMALRAAGMAYGVAGAGSAAGAAGSTGATGGGAGVANMGSSASNFGAGLRYVPLAR